MADVSAVEEKPHTLDDVMIAMDVVDTLRHRDDLVRRELNEEDREAELIARLREIYSQQGITVPDSVLAQGVNALRESRFTYVPAASSWTRTMLEIWARRGVLGRRTGIAAAALLLVWGVYYVTVSRPAQQAAQQSRIEKNVTLPNSIRQVHSDIFMLTTEDAARQKADALLADGERMIRDGDVAGMRRVNNDLVELRNQVTSEYTLRIVSRPGEASGVWRRPPKQPQGRNYYIIVEPIAPDGKKLSLPIRNEETGETETVDRFAVRVPEATYNAIAADKRDDGIIQNNTFGVKRRGKLGVDYAMPFDGGAITKW